MNSISFVLPCLNEENTLPLVLNKINKIRKDSLSNYQSEVVVSDNGSTDNSIKIANEHGARVVHCKTKGYGAALQNGIINAKGDIIIFADADNTYDFCEAPKLVEELEKGYELVIGNRLKGNIEKGAMPFLHRYLGTPVLTFIINQLHAKNGNKVEDCNSGFRCFLKSSYLKWKLNSDGMEFASDMLIKAMSSNTKISHVPISLSKDQLGREPHLRTWNDGMRHLLQILLPASNFFYKIGVMIFLLSWAVLLSSLIVGHVQFYKFGVFGIHSMMFALLGAVIGMSILGLGLDLSVKQGSNVHFYNYILNLKESNVFWISAFLSIVSTALFISIFVQWGVYDFQDLSLEKETLGLISFNINLIQFVFIILSAHLIKRI